MQKTRRKRCYRRELGKLGLDRLDLPDNTKLGLLILQLKIGLDRVDEITETPFDLWRNIFWFATD
jgi:hypothetical protein